MLPCVVVSRPEHPRPRTPVLVPGPPRPWRSGPRPGVRSHDWNRETGPPCTAHAWQADGVVARRMEQGRRQGGATETWKAL